MRKALFLIIPAILLAAACTQRLEPVGEEGTVPAVQEQPSALIPGTLIVQFDEETAAAVASGAATKSGAMAPVFEGLGVTSVERVFADGGEWEPRHRAAGLHRWYRIKYDPAAQAATKAADGMLALPGVVFAEPERRIRKTAYFNDPMAPQQWALYNDGSLGSAYSAGCDLNVQPVWTNYTAGASDVIVAVIDEGVQLDHPDLAAACIPGGADGSKSFIDGYVGYTIPAGDHGTHVAGVIGAVSNNGIGISGIAGGNDGKGGVRILSCAIFREDPSDPEKTIQGDSYNAMVWAADHGAVIANNSWGYVYETEKEAEEGSVGAMGPAIDYFVQYAGCDKEGNQRADSPMKGGLVLFSAGNENYKMSWPAAYDKVVSVGAVSAQFTRAYYSNYGEWVDICAPGGDVKLGPTILSTVAGDGYGLMQGTSMACPQVAGVAALIVSHFGGPGFTGEMLRERLIEGANTTKVSNYLMIGPLADAVGAFTHKGTVPPEPASDVSASVQSNRITLSWKVTSDPDDLKAYGYLALAATDAAALKDLNPRSIPASVKKVTAEVGTLDVGEPISATLSDLAFSTTYYTAVVAYDYAGNYAPASEVKAVTTAGNNPPVIKTEYSGDFKVKPFESLSVEYTVSDPDGHKFSVAVTPGSEALSYTENAGTVTLRIVGNKAPQGTYTAHLMATDAYGAATDLPVKYEILENHLPKVVGEIGDMQFSSAGESTTLDMTKYIQDEDGEVLKYTVSMTEQNVIHLNPNGNAMTLTVLGYGLTTATVTATDACGESVSVSFRVLVRDSSRAVDLYPNPVVSSLFIRPGTDGQIEVAVSNKAGATVWSGSASVTPFDPLSVDLSQQPGGTYYVRIQGAGIDGVYPVVKR